MIGHTPGGRVHGAAAESFDAVLAEAPAVIHDLRSLGKEGYITCSAAADMLEAAIPAHARELAERSAAFDAARGLMARDLRNAAKNAERYRHVIERAVKESWCMCDHPTGWQCMRCEALAAIAKATGASE